MTPFPYGNVTVRRSKIEPVWQAKVISTQRQHHIPSNLVLISSSQ